MPSPLSCPQVVASLAAAGIRRLHIFAHSMGCRLFCSALPCLAPHLTGHQASRIQLHPNATTASEPSVDSQSSPVAPPPPRASTFQSLPAASTNTSAVHVVGGRFAASQPQPIRKVAFDAAVAAPPEPAPCLPVAEGPRIELATTTLLHPEHDLHTFIERDYDLLHAHCGNVTIYMDRKDQALGISELVMRQPSLGKHPFALASKARASIDLDAVQEPSLTAPYSRLMRFLRGYNDSKELDFRRSKIARALDVDVIDTSWMDTNATGPRHAYFNVNRWIIDDLAEVVTTRKRAIARPHRLIRLDRGAAQTSAHAPVYVFLAAPSWVGG